MELPVSSTLHKWLSHRSEEQTLGRFRDRDYIASIFNRVLAKLVVANVRLGSDSDHSLDDTHVVL